MLTQTILDIDNERSRQDQMFGGQDHDDAAMTEEKWALLLAREVGLAAPIDGKSRVDIPRFERQMVRVAATAVAALESLRRRAEERAATPTVEPKVAGYYMKGSGV